MAKTVTKEISTNTATGIYEDVLIHEIIPDPNQPRKQFDEAENIELAASVKEKGVLQPILLRPNTAGGLAKYMVVYGHRRLWAVKKCGGKTIKAQVKEMSDEESLEVQLIENMQRIGVHPMEEARAFKSLSSKSSTEEIAARTGKSASYVAKRISLTSLTDDAQEIFFYNHVTLTDALLLARLDSASQKEIIRQHAPSGWETKLGNEWALHNIKILVSNSEHDLSNAIFNPNDAKLYPEAGPCKSCQFNSANTPLLFDDGKKRICTKSICFSIKTERARKAKFEKIAADPDKICVVLDSYLSEEEQDTVEAAEEAGIKILNTKQYSRVEKPGPTINYDDWFDDETAYLDDEDIAELDQEKMKAEYEEYKADNDKEIEEYQKNMSSGDVISAYVVAGNNAGKEVTIKLNSLAAKAMIDGGGDAETLNEITRIEEREKRNKELDAEKIWTKVRGLASHEALVNEKLLNQEEVTVLLEALKDKLSYNAKQKAEKYLKVANGNDVIAYLSRLFIIDVLPNAYGSHIEEDTNNYWAYRYIKGILPKEMAAIELEQQEVAEQRAERVEKRIAALRKKIKP